MLRIARIIAPGVPHHITQRGNRRMETFFCDEDYQAYLALMAEWCRKFQRIDLVLLPAAKSRSPHRRAGNSRGLSQGDLARRIAATPL